MDWAGLQVFFREVFWPYLVGGVGPGLLVALLSYWITVPLVRVYQANRRRALQEKLARLRNAPGAGPPAG